MQLVNERSAQCHVGISVQLHDASIDFDEIWEDRGFSRSKPMWKFKKKLVAYGAQTSVPRDILQFYSN